MTLATIDPEVCPNCGADLTTLEWGQPALFRHAGHGGTETTERRQCRCGYALTASITTTRPERRT